MGRKVLPALILEIQILKLAEVAQLVEQWTENPCVRGSIPFLGILNLRSMTSSRPKVGTLLFGETGFFFYCEC